MALTANDIINSALRKIGVLASEESPNPQESFDALTELNRIAAAWSTSRKFIFGVAFNTFNLAANQQSYTVGPAGNWAYASRPLTIRTAKFLNNNNEEFPLEPMTSDEYAAEPDKGASARVPSRYYYDNQFPVANFYPFPVPTQPSCRVALWTWSELTQFVNLTDTFSFPKGYEAALVWTLAENLIPDYPRPVDPSVAANVSSMAQLYRQAIQMHNLPPQPGAPQEAEAVMEARALAAGPQQAVPQP